jgi:alpha/beta superfamily hydrolase
MDTSVHEIRRAPTTPDQRVEFAIAHPPTPRAEGAVVFGPQPFLGGDMDNNVVLALQAVLTDHGWPVARFNYRGVGASHDVEPGRHRYEYWREVEQRDDLTAVLEDGREALRRTKSLFPVQLLAGYSFGTTVALALAAELDPEPALVLVAPPFGRVNLEGLADRRAPTLLVLAGRDVLTPPPPVEELQSRFPAVRLDVLGEADHFLLGREHELDGAVGPLLDELVSRSHTIHSDPCESS